MISRRAFLFCFGALLLPFRVRAAELRYDEKTVAGLIPRPSDLGADWHPVHPDRWLVASPAKVTAFYDYKPSSGSGEKPDSVIADIFIFASPQEADKMLQAARQKAAAVKENVVREAPALSKDAFISHYGPEARHGERVTFQMDNLVITLAPSQHGVHVAGKLKTALEAK